MLTNLNIIKDDITASDKKKGLFINASGISCIPCRCKRQPYHKETKTTKENIIVTTMSKRII